MGRMPCCSTEGLNRGAWTAEEDRILKAYVQIHGEGRWRILPKKSGLKRCGKSCRLRWLNYLRPDIKRGNISDQEEDLIVRLHRLLGNKWSLIAGRLPGRTDNEIKNYWNTTLKKRVKNRSPHEAKCKQDEEKLQVEAAPAAGEARPVHAQDHAVLADGGKSWPMEETPEGISSSATEKQYASAYDKCSSLDPPMEGIWDFLLNGDVVDENPSLHSHDDLQRWDNFTTIQSPIHLSQAGILDDRTLVQPVLLQDILEDWTVVQPILLQDDSTLGYLP